MSNPFFDDLLRDPPTDADSVTDGAEPGDGRSFAERIAAKSAAAWDVAATSFGAAAMSNGYATWQAKLDAVDHRNAAIRDASGVELDNPYRTTVPWPSPSWSPFAALDRGISWARDVTSGRTAPYDPEIEGVDAWMRQLSDLAQRRPDLADVIKPDLSPQQEAYDAWRGAEAQRGRAAASTDLDAAIRFGAGLAGGLAGGLTDPETLATTLLTLAVPSTVAADGGSLLGRFVAAARPAAEVIEASPSIVRAVTAGALETAAANAAFEAVSSPSHQDWRAEMGLDHGVFPALEDIATAGAIGAVPGVVAGGLRAIAGRIVAADRTVVAARPEPVGIDEHARTFEDTLTRALDPTAPPPEPPVPRAMAPDEPRAAADLREGWSRLPDDAAALAHERDIPPEFAAHVGLMSPAPEEHAALVETLAEARPSTSGEARRIIADAMSEKTRAPAMRRMLDTEKPEAQPAARIAATASPSVEIDAATLAHQDPLLRLWERTDATPIGTLDAAAARERIATVVDACKF